MNQTTSRSRQPNARAVERRHQKSEETKCKQ
nr:MAG TPA: hypothetical protein [Caudoviricetes sp.]